MSVIVKIVSQFDPKGINRAEGSLDGLKRSAALAGAAVAAAGAAIAVGLGKAVKAAAEDQKSFEQLAQSMRNLTGASDAFIGQMDRQIGKMSMAAGIADDKLRPAFANLLRATGSTAVSQKALTTAMDLSVATGRDLDAVSLSLGKALNGQTTALFKLLPGLKGVVDEGSTAEEVLAAINSQVGGAAEANAKTFAGSLERMKVIFGEMVETVGGALLPILTQVAVFLNTHLSAAFTYLSETVGPALQAGLARIATVFTEQVLPVLRDYVIPAFLYLADIYYTKILPAVGLIAEVLVEKLGKAFTMIRGKIEANSDSFAKLRDFMDKAVVFVTRYVVPTYGKALGVALDLAIGYVGALIDVFVKVGNVVGPIMTGIVRAVGGMVRGLVNGLNFAIDAVNAFIGIYNRLPGFLKPFGDIGLLPTISLPDFDLTNYKPGGFGYFGDNRGAMGAPGAGGLDLGLGGTAATGSSGGRSGARTGGAIDFGSQAPPSMGQTSGFNPIWDLSLIDIVDTPELRAATAGITVNVNGGLATSADVGRAVVDAIKQYTNVSGPADIAVA